LREKGGRPRQAADPAAMHDRGVALSDISGRRSEAAPIRL
jgi:hypothetical protein